MDTFSPHIPLTTGRASLYNLCLFLYRKIATHPLINAPLVRHPLTNEVISIDKYKLKNGIEMDDSRLCCSIFPHSTPTDGLSLPKPAETSLSTLFHQKDIGDEFDNGIYHIGIKLHYNTQTIFIPHPDETLKEVPYESQVHHSQEGYINEDRYKNVKLDLNPALPILSDYLELVRLAILDKQHLGDYPVPVRNINVMYFNLKEAPWEQNRSIYFSEAEILVRLDISVGRDWRHNLKDPDNIICRTFRIIIGRTDDTNNSSTSGL